ncbi:MAG: mandelate racemase/muconate lactonizing enzyme family protein [Saprospiraceae bacterium]|nr:mandelate racemase/muconate lactonizing enzyme family protein [Saprospiraceae bacterium]
MMKRRAFINVGAMSALSLFGPKLSTLVGSAQDLEPLRITKIETVRFSNKIKIAGRGIQWMWVRLHTNQGIIGTGETYPFNEASEAAVADLQWHSWAGKLLGTNPLEIEQTWSRIFRQTAYHVTGGAEMRALSAINIAQWDILGQVSGLPIYQLMGGSANKSIRVYNTYTNARHINGWRLEDDMPAIASFLVDQGITAIKFCPFDKAARENNGEYISQAQIQEGLDWIRKVQDTVGDRLDIGCEFHSWWNIPSAIRIASALEPFNILFLEDLLLQHNAEAYRAITQHTSIPLANSERWATRFDFRDFIEADIGGIVMYDLTWCGGISEGKKISDMANTHFIPTMMHTAGGPILWYASIQLAAAISNLFYVESVYPNWKERYPYFFDNVPKVVDGSVRPPDTPGLGLQFKPGLFERADVMVKTIAEE